MELLLLMAEVQRQGEGKGEGAEGQLQGGVKAVETLKEALRAVQAIARQQKQQQQQQQPEGAAASSMLSPVTTLEAATWRSLAVTYARLGRLADADVALAKARHLDPYGADTWHTAGEMLLSQ